jgi:uncharacterized membrane protein YagU involved in acid resistance
METGMYRPRLSARGAIWWGGLAAGLLDLAAVFAFWAVRDVPPTAILRSIASALLGPAAAESGSRGALLALFLHVAVSFAFAASYVVLSSRAPVLRARPIAGGVAYGLVAYVVMTFVVVPLSRATFGTDWPPPLLNLAASLFIHLFLFGLPIALAASRIARPGEDGGGTKVRFSRAAS